ncbi:MAG: right-handed parallel beta-helix repeat-containing protein [Acidobacteriota bacterium]
MVRRIAPLAFVVCVGALAAELHVSPAGPLTTLSAARDAARKLPAAEPKRIVVHGGKYFFTEPLVLDARDSGLTIEAAPGETPVLYGGQRITGWQRDGENFWAAKIPERGGQRWHFRLLVVNDRVCRPARLPDSGYLTHASEFPVRWMGTSGGGWQRKPTEEELTTLKYRDGDLGPWLDVNSAEITIYHMWDESLARPRAIDTAARTVTLATPAGHPPGAFGVQRYVVWNVREGMHAPGQWYLDRTAGKVVYWPSPGEDMRAAEAIAPTMESIIRLEGTKDTPVKDVTLRGLALSVTDTPPVAGGFGAGKYDGAVSANYAENCRLERLVIYNTGGQGIKALNTTSMRVVNTEVRDTGAGGILLRGAAAEIADNHVYRVGLRYPSAIGIYCGGQNLNVSHNEVHDTTYTAINCGGSGHRIENNLLYRAMTELHDGAAIYFIFGKNITLRGNLVRDIPDTGGYGSSAYYIDELSEGCLVEHNVSIGVARPSHNHMAKKNTIRNNVFLFDGDMRITLPRSSEFRFENNILWAKGRIVVSNPEAIAESSGNVFCSASRQVEGAPPGTLLADPQLQVEGRRYSFAPGSPAAKLGIEPVDVSAAGRRVTIALK